MSFHYYWLLLIVCFDFLARAGKRMERNTASFADGAAIDPVYVRTLGPRRRACRVVR